MIIDFVATISAGFALAGVALVLRSLTRRWLPAWIVPAAAGLGMLSFAIWNEYTWHSRTVGALPDGVVVARAQAETAPWRPWTYIRPIVTRFSAVDTRRSRTNPEVPGLVADPPCLLLNRDAGSRASAGASRLRRHPGARRAALTQRHPARRRVDWEELPETDETLRASVRLRPLAAS
jgi:hypothetical protein